MNKLPEFDCYAELCVRKDAPRHEIARAHRKLARIYHPDLRHPPDVAAELARDPDRYQRIEQAWEVLGDDASRKAYDEARALLPRPQMPPALRYLDLMLSGGLSWGEYWVALLGFCFSLAGYYDWETEHPRLVRIGGRLDWIQHHSGARYTAMGIAALVALLFVASLFL